MMRGMFGSIVIGGDLNSAVHMGEHPASPQHWRYRWTGVLLGRCCGVGLLYRVHESAGEATTSPQEPR
jgi:hypothetical protein